MFDGGSIYLGSKKQICITDSTMAASTSLSKKRSKMVKRFTIYNIPLWPKSMALISIHCGRKVTLSKAYTEVYNGKSRYIDVRQLITDGATILDFVRSSQTLADPQTKGLTRDLAFKTSIGIGFKPIILITNGGSLTQHLLQFQVLSSMNQNILYK